MAVRFCVNRMDDDGEQPMDLAEYAFAILVSFVIASGRACE